MRRHAACLAFLLAAAPAVGQTVTFGVGRDGSSFLGERVRLPLWVDMSASGGELLGSFTVRVTYSQVVIGYQTVHNGTFGHLAVQTDSVASGVLRIAGVAPQGAGGWVHLGDIDYYPYRDSTTTIDVEVLEASAARTFTDLVPFVATSPGAYCGARGRWGDVDDDGDANSRDALVVLSDVVGLPPVPGHDVALGDVDGDGLANTRDALILLSYAVGIDISGQRVLTVAPGACALDGGAALTIAPDTVDVVPGQTVPLRVVSRDAGGTPVVLNGLNWVVGDPRIGHVVQTTNTFEALDTGTTVLRAHLGPGVFAEVPVIVRARRGTWHVNAAAGRWGLAMGTARYPMLTPQQAFPLLATGDTIRIAPGTHDYDDALTETVSHGFVLIGDTLADGTRPVLRAPDNCCNAMDLVAFQTGSLPAHVEIRDLVFENFVRVVAADNAGTIVMRNVDALIQGPGNSGYGLDIDNRIDTLDLEDVLFMADSVTGLYNDAIRLDGGAGSLVRLVNVRAQNWDYGLYVNGGPDSLHLVGSHFQNILYPVYLGSTNRPVLGMHAADNVFLNNYRGIYVPEIQRASLVRNTYDLHDYRVLELSAPNPALPGEGPVRYSITADTVRAPGPGYDWLYATGFDSLLVSDVLVDIDTTGIYTTMSGGYVHVRRSTLDGVTQEGFDVGARTAVFDTVTVIGCPTCAFGSISGINGVSYDGSGPTLTVNGGTFRRLGTAVNLITTAIQPGLLTVRHIVADSVDYGITGYADSAIIEDNTITVAQLYGIRLYPSGDRPASFAYEVHRNVAVCDTVGGTQYGLYVERTATTFSDNYAQDCDHGIYVYSTLANILDVSFTNDSVFATGNTGAAHGVYVQNRWRPTLRGVRVRGADYGIRINTNDTATIVIDSSAVSQSGTAGIWLQPGTGASVVGTRNNVVNNVLDGILNSVAGTRSFTLGRFVGNGRWAINSTLAFDASQNWWGNATGPGPGNGADSVTTGAVVTTPFLTVDPGDVPPPAPPAMGAARAPLPDRRARPEPTRR